MSAMASSLGPKRARSHSDDEAPPILGYDQPQTPPRRYKKHHAAHGLLTPPTTVDRTVAKRPGSSFRPINPPFRLGSPLSPTQLPRGHHGSLSKSQSTITEVDEEILSDADSEATEAMSGDVYDQYLNMTKPKEAPSLTPKAFPGKTVLNLDQVLPTGRQPAPIKELQFRCSYPQGCDQTQTEIGASRKLIADKFGRNKKNCRIILFPRWCRKHYQQTSYKSTKKGEDEERKKERHRAWGKMKIGLIRDTLDIIDGQQRGVRFDLRLKKSEQERLHADNQKKLAPGYHLPARKPIKGQYESPLFVLREFAEQFMEAHATRENVNHLLDWAQDLLNRGVVQDCPCFEMVPQWSAATVKKYAWAAELNKSIDEGAQQEDREVKVKGKKTPSVGTDAIETASEAASTKQLSTAMEDDNKETDAHDSDADNESEDCSYSAPELSKSVCAFRRTTRNAATQKPVKK